MTEMDRAWERLLDYRERVRGWMTGEVPLADTRLRVARLLDAGFGYGWDDVEADFQAVGHRADFALALDGRRWGIVLVRAMGSGTGDGPPPEAFVLADGADLRWTWVTDGASLAVFHVGPDLAARPIAMLDLVHDTEGALRQTWELLCRAGVAEGRLEAHRRSLLRPDPAAIRKAMRSPEVLAALRHVLSYSFPNIGTDQELATSLGRLLDDGTWDEDEGPAAPPAFPSAAETANVVPPHLANGNGTPAAVSTPAPAAHGQSNGTPERNGHTPQPPAPPEPTPPAANGDGQPKRRRRGGGWRLTEEGEAPEMADEDEGEADPVAAVPPAPAVAIPTAAVPTPEPAPEPAEPPSAEPQTPPQRQAPAAETLVTTMEKQRQTHERLRQNLRELKENRARLQDALSELQKDYPERFERIAAGPEPEAVGAGARQASWTLLGHLQSMGNGYWEWSAADNGGPGVRLN